MKTGQKKRCKDNHSPRCSKFLKKKKKILVFLQPPIFPFIANHDIIWYGVSLVGSGCVQDCVNSQPIAQQIVTQLCVTVRIREGLVAST